MPRTIIFFSHDCHNKYRLFPLSASIDFSM